MNTEIFKSQIAATFAKVNVPYNNFDFVFFVFWFSDRVNIFNINSSIYICDRIHISYIDSPFCKVLFLSKHCQVHKFINKISFVIHIKMIGSLKFL